MALASVHMRVEMDTPDGPKVAAVTVDQRDFARAEAEDILPRQKHTWMRFLGYAALARTGRYTGTWVQFNTTDCIEVAEEQGQDGGEAPDPGRPDRGAGS